MYELVVVLLNGDRRVDADLCQMVLGHEFRTAKGRGMLTLANQDVVFQDTGFPTHCVPSFYHRLGRDG